MDEPYCKLVIYELHYKPVQKFPAPIQLIGIAIISWSELRWQWKTNHLFKYLIKKTSFLCLWMIKAIFMLLKETVPFCLLSGLVYCTDFWNEDTGKFISRYLSFLFTYSMMWLLFIDWPDFLICYSSNSMMTRPRLASVH